MVSERMEFGPRALGNRSILASQLHKAMKDILNKKVKHRENFRPFSCSVLSEYKDIYFENVQESPFMLKVFKIKKEFRDKFPAICHVDFTCRIHTVTYNQNPLLYQLLLEMKRLTGFGIVLNTSLNISGEPIVNTPEEALNLVKRTEIDVLILGNYIIKKTDLHRKFEGVATQKLSNYEE